METIQLFNSLPATKSEMDLTIQNCVDDILSGKKNPIDIAIKLKVMEDIVKAIRANQDFKDFVMDTAEKTGLKTFDFNGAKITIAEVSKFDFSEDAQWSQMDNEITLKKEILKIRENTLKNLDKEMADPLTGEIYTPPTKTMDKQIRISLK